MLDLMGKGVSEEIMKQEQPALLFAALQVAPSLVLFRFFLESVTLSYDVHQFHPLPGFKITLKNNAGTRSKDSITKPPLFN
jgi:hypothetical protein